MNLTIGETNSPSKIYCSLHKIFIQKKKTLEVFIGSITNGCPMTKLTKIV